MKRATRVLVGSLCIVLGLVVTALLGFGFGPAGGVGAPALVAVLPSVSFGLAICAVGVWLISTGRSR